LRCLESAYAGELLVVICSRDRSILIPSLRARRRPDRLGLDRGQSLAEAIHELKPELDEKGVPGMI
jgi:hypothetical protein